MFDLFTGEQIRRICIR